MPDAIGGGTPEHARASSDALGSSDTLSDVFSALADPSRRHVLGYLADHGTATATQLTRELPMTRQAVSKHLAALSGAGLVSAERAGRETRYRLTEAGAEWDDRLDALLRHLQGSRG